MACAIVVAMASSVAAQTANQGYAKVVHIKGNARYTTGNNVWLPLKTGAKLKPGTIVQTAPGSYVDLVLGEGDFPAPSVTSTKAGSSGGGGGGGGGGDQYQPNAEQNVIRIQEDSALGIDKLTTTETGTDTVSETQLDLQRGKIFGNVKKMSAASKYEVKIPNGVAGIRGTIYTVSAAGVVQVLVGSVVLAYVGPDGQPLHIAHLIKVTVRRPDRLLIEVSGDDGSHKLIYNGKTVVLFGVETKQYTSIPVPNTIQEMMKEVMGRRGVDFPLVDFLTDNPGKSFLLGITSGREVNTVTIDGVPVRHLLFFQPPGIELELWLEKNDQALPRRLIVTYRNLPGEPSYIAEFSDWNFSIHPADADFEFTTPADAKQVELKPTNAAAPARPKGAKP